MRFLLSGTMVFFTQIGAFERSVYERINAKHLKNE